MKFFRWGVSVFLFTAAMICYVQGIDKGAGILIALGVVFELSCYLALFARRGD